jgi:hypothetical protein
MKSLPARPSLESLRKQARKLARDIATGDADATARAREHLPHADPPLTQRNAQLVIAREYGFAGWQELTTEVHRRLGDGLEWAAAQARRLIHDNDIERLRELLAEYPALLSWRGEERECGLLGFATSAYGDAFDPERERNFTRAACAELLIDAGAIVVPGVIDGIVASRARGLLELLRRKHLLPRTLRFLAALGDPDAVRTALEGNESDLAAVNEAFLCACHFEHAAVASLLLDRCIALDPELGGHVEGGPGRDTFIESLAAKLEVDLAHAIAVGPWKAFVLSDVTRTLRVPDLAAFGDMLRRETWLLGEAYAWFQARLIETATLNDRGEFIVALLDVDPALLRIQPPPPSQAIEIAFTYAHTHLLPLLTRIWTVPDDLPYAAGLGDPARVGLWFDEPGRPALGDLDSHYPNTNPRVRADLHWTPPAEQHVLDVALAFAVINHHFDVADFLLEHGADIDTDWNSHEPASILHHLVFEDDYEAMRFLIDRGIDLTLRDYRWNSTARGWASHGKQDPAMARWLETAERRRTGGRSEDTGTGG